MILRSGFNKGKLPHRVSLDCCANLVVSPEKGGRVNPLRDRPLAQQDCYDITAASLRTDDVLPARPGNDGGSPSAPGVFGDCGPPERNGHYLPASVPHVREYRVPYNEAVANGSATGT
ncbi:hypothetical protein GN956_G4268 [Arapaima gigas]